MDALINWWKSVTGTQEQTITPVVENPSGMSDGVQGGRKKKTRRGGKNKSRKSKPRRK